VLQSEPEFLVLNRSSEPINRVKALFSSLIMAGTLITVAFNPMTTGEILLAGALAMVLFKVLDMDQAYRAVDWKSVFLIAGLLPMGIALTKTGVAELLSSKMLMVLGNQSTIVLLAGLIALVIIFTQVMNGAAVAAIMAPIAIQLASISGIDPRSLASSIAFITPLGHPVNILVMGPGGYKFRDYAKLGILLTIIVYLIILIVLPIFWHLA
jgi:di/tricarboxylate transporter